MSSDLAALMSEREAILEEIKKRRLESYSPYPKQALFHALGAIKRERGFLAGNQLGKTTSGAAEAAYHATGKYPDWWQGKCFEHPTIGWAAGNSNETTRDNPQRMLFGRPGEIGHGMIPGGAIIDIKKARGIADYIDTATIRHATGGISRIRFKSYELGWEKFQGETLDWFWGDEEPPSKVYSEALTRTNAGDRGRGGIAWLTATPLMGMTDVMRRFYPEPEDEHKALVMMEIWDVGHYSDEHKKKIVAGYPAHERAARSKGIPTLGSGVVFPVQQSMLEVVPFELPNHFYQLAGSDFGWDHPTAFVRCAIDRDSGIFYVVDAYKQAEQVVAVHAAAVKPWGTWMPVAWPHDGYVHDKQSGEQTAESYRKEGLNMMHEHATHPAGGYGTEAGVQEMYQAMLTGKFKVFGHLQQWFQEAQSYHRKDGQIVKLHDDLMSATRMAWMMQRYARTSQKVYIPQTAESYDPFAETFTPQGAFH